MKSLCVKVSIFYIVLSLILLNALSADLPHRTRRLVVIDKALKKLVLLKDGMPVAEFPASFGIDPNSDKYRALDAATPEGLYFITHKKPESRFHRFLGLSYPNLTNAARGLAGGVISLNEYKRLYQALMASDKIPRNTGLGCGIGIHGGGVYRYFGKTRERDWTKGCIALDNPAVDTVFDFCRPGDPAIIFNSSRNLCGIIRPFTQLTSIGENGVPLCVDGICTYQIQLSTFLGRTKLSVSEGKENGRSITVVVYDHSIPEKELLTLVDRNSDGHLYELDGISGPISDGKTPEETYALVKEAVILSLSRGEILYPSKNL